MLIETFLIAIAFSTTSLTITEPVYGATYDGDWLTVRAIVENEIPENVRYTLNAQSPIEIPRLNTDWYTYMANDLHIGFSESPAPADNTILWTAPVTGNSHEFCSPVVVNGVVYFVSDEQSIAYALDAATGDIMWQYDVVDHVDDAVTLYEGKVYVSADSAWCLDALSGERIWAFKPAPFIKMNGTPALCNGVAYFSFAPDYYSLEIHALDAENGEQIWFTEIPIWSVLGVQHGSSGIADGMVFYGEGAGKANGKIVALSCESGDEIWSYQTGGTEIFSSPAITDGVVYIAGMDSNLYAFGTGFKYTYLDDFYAQVGANELIVTSYDGGSAVAADTINFTVTGTGISLEPTRLHELTVTPNPFISTASISFKLSEPGLTTIDVYDLSGRTISTIENSVLDSGEHSVQWNGIDQNGEPVPAGLYLCIIQSGGTIESTGLCLLR